MMPEFKCHGFCKFVAPEDGRRIISISSCSDYESTVDGPEPHQNMTYMLVEILEEHVGRELTLHSLMQQLSFRLYEHSTEFIECNRRWNREDKQRLKENGLPATSLGQCRVGLQSPQLGSLYPLNLHDKFEL